MPKSWWTPSENRIKDDDTPEEIDRKNLYAKLCASKKPYFFAYNYVFLKKEYDQYIKNARSNAIALYKKTIDEMIILYERGQLFDEYELKFIRNYLFKLPLDMSKSTMNKICFAIEREFDEVDLFKDVYFDYNVLKSGALYDSQTYDVIKHICQSYRPSVQLAKKRAVINVGNNDEDDWDSVDMLLVKLIEDLTKQCPNEEELCDILVDLCYRDGISKTIVWSACGGTIYTRLLHLHNYRLSYPRKDINGDFWCQGVKYLMDEIIVKDGDLDEIPI